MVTRTSSAVEALAAHAPRLLRDPERCVGTGWLVRNAVAEVRGSDTRAVLAALDRITVPAGLGDQLAARWAGLAACARVRVGPPKERADHARAAIAGFEQSLAGGDTVCPPAEGSPPPGCGSAFAGRSWTIGTYIAYDALRASGRDRRVIETTPLLIDLGEDGGGTVVRLAVERLPGPTGVVTPDWWQIGLVRFSGGPGDFLGSIQQVLVAALAASQPQFRLRWWVDRFPADGLPMPLTLTGQSAEAAAACAALAVLRRTSDDAGALLDKAIAVTARVVGTKQLLHRKLGRLRGRSASIPNKLAAARTAGLTGVVFAYGQEPRDLTVTTGQTGGPPQCVTVRTVGDAFEALLTMTRAERQFRVAIVNKWQAEWATRGLSKENSRM